MRSARKLTTVAATAALIGAGALAVAPPASATVTSASITDNGNGTITVTYSGTVDGNTSFYICGVGVSPCTTGAELYGLNTGPVGIPASPFTLSAGTSVNNSSGTAATALPAGTYQFRFVDTGGGGADTTLASAVIGGSGGGGSSSGSSGGPAAWIQQFGIPASGNCEDGAPAELNTAGVGAGGWGTSWAQWMNSGTGGAVCTRTLSYVGGAWTVS